MKLSDNDKFLGKNIHDPSLNGKSFFSGKKNFYNGDYNKMHTEDSHCAVV